jgi:hypothetical protein
MASVPNSIFNRSHPRFLTRKQINCGLQDVASFLGGGRGPCSTRKVNGHTRDATEEIEPVRKLCRLVLETSSATPALSRLI